MIDRVLPPGPAARTRRLPRGTCPPYRAPVEFSGQQHIRNLLLRERDEALARLDGTRRELAAIVAAARETASDDEHDPEGATIAFDRAQVAALERSAVDQLAEIDAALARLAAGTYGRCERCGQEIPLERLAARPTARRCTPCAARNT